jgi:hypothetical protein
MLLLLWFVGWGKAHALPLLRHSRFWKGLCLGFRRVAFKPFETATPQQPTATTTATTTRLYRFEN